jgi:hypothetical protein
MLCRRDGATINVNVFGCTIANQIARKAIQVVFPACRLQRTTILFFSSRRRLAWYSLGVKPKSV